MSADLIIRNTFNLLGFYHALGWIAVARHCRKPGKYQLTICQFAWIMLLQPLGYIIVGSAVTFIVAAFCTACYALLKDYQHIPWRLFAGLAAIAISMAIVAVILYGISRVVIYAQHKAQECRVIWRKYD